MRKLLILLIGLVTGVLSVEAAQPYTPLKKEKVVVDNDFCGDPDGLVQLVHQLLCPTCDIQAIVGGHLADHAGFTQRKDQATASCEKAHEVLQLLGMDGQVTVVPGAEHGLEAADKPIDSEGARAIIAAAKECTPDKPLFVLCGGSLTNVASAHLLDPTIDDRIIVVWIGGQEYEGVGSYPPPGYSRVEYNLNLSIPAAQVIFNKSNMRLWQVPRDVYRQCLYSMAEMRQKFAATGKVGKYLTDQVEEVMKNCEKFNLPMGETYVLGDSPLVLLSALRSGFEADPSSSFYKYVACPVINDDGSYGMNHQGRLIRVYTHLDTRLMFADLEAKLSALQRQEPASHRM